MNNSLIALKFFFVIFIGVIFQCICEGIATGNVFTLDYSTAGWIIFSSYWLVVLSLAWNGSTVVWDGK